jgi:hypothetical protein
MWFRFATLKQEKSIAQQLAWMTLGGAHLRQTLA